MRFVLIQKKGIKQDVVLCKGVDKIGEDLFGYGLGK